MTDLIPLDAVRNEVARLGQEFLDGGSPTTANVLNLAMDRINTIPAIDPAALREAYEVVYKWWFGDGNALPQELILAMIGEKK